MDLSRKPLLGHLEELLSRARRSFLWVSVGFGLGYSVSAKLLRFLEEPLLARLPAGSRIVFSSPFEKFWVHIRLSLFVGVFLVLPLLIWEVGAFMGPALSRLERRRLASLVVAAGLAFAAGLGLGYQFVLPAIIEAFLNFGGDISSAFPWITLSSYLNTTLGILLFSALFMEIPVFMIFLSAWGWVEPASWARSRKVALVANALVSAILSPPDVLSMLIMMLPLQILYECGIVGARMAKWKGHEKPSPSRI